MPKEINVNSPCGVFKFLRPQLAKTAKDIASLNESVGTITSKMVKRSELDSFADEIIGGLGEKTQSSIRSYMGKTGARIDDISERFRVFTF